MSYIKFFSWLFCTCVLIVFQHTVYAQEELGAQEFLPLDSLLNVHVSTASRHWQKINEAPASISIITAEQIVAYGYETIADALNSLSGFYLSEGGSSVDIGTRGFSRTNDHNNRILFMLNGHPMNENVFGSAAINNERGLNFNSIDHIEIVRGSASALYGTGAMFDVVNIITRHDQPLATGSADVFYGTRGIRRASAFYSKKFERGPDVLLSAAWGDAEGERRYFHEFDVPGVSDGNIDAVGKEEHRGVYGHIQYHGLALQGLASLQTKNVVVDNGGLQSNGHIEETSNERQFLGIEYNNGFANTLQVRIASSYDRYQYRMMSLQSSPTNDSPTGEWFSEEAQARWNVNSQDVLVFGIEARQNPYSSYFNPNTDTIATDRNKTFSLWSFYINNDYQINPVVAVTGGVRYDRYSTSPNSLSPRAGIIITPHPTTTIKLLYGKGYRSPNYYESYLSEQPLNMQTAVPYNPGAGSIGDSAGVNAVPEQKPERINSAEAIWEQRINDKLFGMLSLYWYQINDLINSSMVFDPRTPWQGTKSIETMGAEVSTQYYFNTDLSGYFNYSYQHAVDKNGDVQLSNSPEHLFKIGGTWRSSCGMSLSSEFFYETERFTEQGTETAPFAIWNVVAMVRFLNEHIVLRASVKNLLDRHYQLPGGYTSGQIATEQRGREMDVKLQYAF